MKTSSAHAAGIDHVVGDALIRPSTGIMNESGFGFSGLGMLLLLRQPYVQSDSNQEVVARFTLLANWLGDSHCRHRTCTGKILNAQALYGENDLELKQ